MLRKRLSQPGIVSVFIAAALIALVIFIRHLGWLQGPELYVYDLFTRWRSDPAANDDRIVIVALTENDIHLPHFDYPVTDGQLATVLKNILRAKPCVVGVDLYLDMPVPKDGSQAAALNEVLSGAPELINIFQIGNPFTIPPPAAVRNMPERIAFNDFPFDRTTARRGMLYCMLGAQAAPYSSLPFAVASRYLEKNRHIVPEGDPAPPHYTRIGKTTFIPFSGSDGGYVNADDQGYQFFLDFKGPRTFRTFTFDDAYSGRIPDIALANKIVLVGVTAESENDYITTPTETSCRGIDLHAQTVNQLLRAALEGDAPTRVWSKRAELGWIVFCASVAGLLAFFVRSPIKVALLGGAGIVLLGLIAWRLFLHGVWLPMAAPLAATIPTATLIASYGALIEQRQRQILMRMFARSVSRDIAESLWERRDEFMEGNRPRPQRMTATVLFTDIAGYSHISETIQPELLIEWMNEYMEILVDQVQQNRGIVAKFIGDAIMAVFGVPIPRSTEEQIRDDARNAGRCALGMFGRLTALNERWRKAGRPEIRTRVGIFSGPLVAGCLGGAERIEYTVLGDIPNTASRLESFDKEYDDPEDPVGLCRILIGEPTARLLEGDPAFRLKLVGTINLKGKEGATTIYRLLPGKLEDKA